MTIISYIERNQHEVIERILRGHQSGAMVGGQWEGAIRTLANSRAPPRPRRRTDATGEVELVLDAEFLESQRLEARLENPAAQPHELQLVLDPEYL